MDASTLRDRLRGIVRPASGATAALPAVESAESADRGDGAGFQLEQLGGNAGWHETPSGRSFVVRCRFDASRPYGRHVVGQWAASLERAAVAATSLGPATARPPFLFFDLETTGLNGGAGTRAFLVGCGWFDGAGAFVTEQHLLIDYAAERGMLRVIADDVMAGEETAKTLVSFNGKSFDAPVLETRYLFHRLESPCAAMPHIDVLHPARRFWGGVGEDGCSLVALEREILGARRVGDVAGFEVPTRYFQFIRTGDPRPLAAVLEHNRLDLLSLAALTARLMTLIDGGPSAATTAKEALALGHVYLRSGETARADESFARALAMSRERDHEHRIDALRALALGARRQRRYADAAELWRRLLEVPGCPQTAVREAIQALAVHHEHRARDLDAARDFALKSLKLELAPARGDAARHRLARIERKISGQSPPVSSLPLLPASEPPTSAPRTSS